MIPMTAAPESNPCFSLELALRIDSAGRKRLDRDFDFGRQLVNATLGTALGRRTQMRQTPEWKAACAMPKGKERTKAFSELSKRFGIASAYDFEKILQAHANASGRAKQLHSDIKQVLADNLWKSWSNWRFEGKGRPRFKGASRGLHTLRGKKNATGISWKPDEQRVRYGGKLYRVHIPAKDVYAREALRDPSDPTKWRKVKYCTLVRKTIYGKTKYFVQILFEGYPPTRIVPAPKTLEVGIDPSMQSMTLVFNSGAAAKVTTTPSVEDRTHDIRRLQRAMDRSRRATNPENFQENGVAKKGVKVWKQSKAYRQLRNEVANLQRRRAATRKRDHGKLINLILQSAGHIRVEENCWKAFQRNRFGKSVGDGAPSEFIQRLLSKAERAGSTGIEMNPRAIKPTQCDPLTGEFKKHALWERRIRLGETNLFLDRDVAAALNLLFHNPETGERDAVGEVVFLEAVKPIWLDAGILVEVPAANRLSKRELRQILRNGINPVSVERLHPKTFLSSVGDVESKEMPHGICSGLKSPLIKETPLLQ